MPCHPDRVRRNYDPDWYQPYTWERIRPRPLTPEQIASVSAGFGCRVERILSREEFARCYGRRLDDAG